MSDITLTAGMRSNLMSLQQTSVLTSRTQNRLSTGKSVNSSVDDPSKYFEALSLNQRADTLTSLKSSMGDAIQIVKAASAGVDSALAILIPILEEVVGWDSVRIREAFEDKGLLIQQWDKVQTDMLTIVPTAMPFEQVRVAIAD